jgi:hypothetical protein
VRGAPRAAGIDAVHDLAGRADRPVEAEVVRNVLDDLLEGGGEPSFLKQSYK